MKTKRINWLMVPFSFIGGILGALASEFILNILTLKIPDCIVVGLCFGVQALFIASAYFIAELLNPVLSGYMWKSVYAGKTLKFLALTSLIFIFIAASILQFIYGKGLSNSKKTDDLVVLVDVSGSMAQNDPTNARLTAVENLINTLDEDKRAAVFAFNHETDLLQPMHKVDSDYKKVLHERLEDYKTANGATDIKKVLEASAKHIKSTTEEGKKAMVLLFTDGLDNRDLSLGFEDSVKEYKDMMVPVYTVGLGDADYNMLKELSRDTNGTYYNIENLENINELFNKIYNSREQRLLNDRRNGTLEDSRSYTIMRVAFITVIGILIAIGMGLMFDNKNIAKAFLLGGILSGLLAGLVMEIGFNLMPWHPLPIRLSAGCILAVMFSLIPVNIRINADNKSIHKESGYNDSIEMEHGIHRKILG